MKTSRVIAIWYLLSAICFSAFAQGSLTPPGAPAPTMKSLDQIEARTPISSAPFTINAPGSYYLTTNLTVSSGNGITINANNVMVNLNGFTLSSSAQPPYGAAILLNGACTNNVTILNGFISGGVTNNGVAYGGSGFSNGVYCLNSPSNVRVSGVSVFGCLGSGIFLPLTLSSCLVESCTVNTVGNTGIQARTVANSTAVNCGYAGVFASTVHNCYGSGYSYMGVYANVADNCQGTSVTGVGLNALSANNCWGNSTSSNGLYATTATTCSGSSSTATGISVQMANFCYGQSSSGTGLSANIATSCYGYSSSSLGLSANIANSCVGHGSPAMTVTNKYNMP